MKNWDDIRVFLAVARAKSGAGGARQLGIDQSTVSRRINSFEKKAQVRLFDRHRDGYHLTAAGEELMKTALRIEDDVAEINRSLIGQDTALTGTIRVTTVDTIANFLMIPVFKSFLEAHPDIDLRVHVSYDQVSLSRSEADVAIRISNNPPEGLIGRKLTTLAFADYTSRTYLEKRYPNKKEEMTWVGWDSETLKGKWPGHPVPKKRKKVLFNTISSIVEAVKIGMGISTLPCFIGDTIPNLVRLSPASDYKQVDLWLLTHRDLRLTARVRAFNDHIADALKKDKEKFQPTAIEEF